MATLDLSTAVDRVRLTIGDTSDMEWLSDTEIEYALSSNNNNENAAAKQCAQFILARMAYSGHERLDKLEFWGDAFDKYMRFLKEVINSSTMNGTAGIYVGGMDKAEFINNANDDTLVQRAVPSYFRDVYEDVYDTVRTERTY